MNIKNMYFWLPDRGHQYRKKIFNLPRKRFLFLENGFHFSDNDINVPDNIFYISEKRLHFLEKVFTLERMSSILE